MNLKFLFHSGKNPKFVYFSINWLGYILPTKIFKEKLESLLQKIERHPQRDYILWRRDYYCKTDEFSELPDSCRTIGENIVSRRRGATVYFFDTYNVTKYFPEQLKWRHDPGDITYVPEIPAVLKSRPIHGDNRNSVLLNLNKIRHFIFVSDKKRFRDKKNMAVFRGKVKDVEQRILFMEKFFGHPFCDCGDTGRGRAEWHVQKMTIYDHLDYKFIMAIEGNDVASNLKWIMSSNSIAVMPRPKYETWFMEGCLVPDYHYIEVKPDFSDLVKKLEWYASHEDKAEEIIRHANEYVAQFKNREVEKLTALAVMDKYFSMTNSTWKRKLSR